LPTKIKTKFILCPAITSWLTDKTTNLELMLCHETTIFRVVVSNAVSPS